MFMSALTTWQGLCRFLTRKCRTHGPRLREPLFPDDRLETCARAKAMFETRDGEKLLQTDPADMPADGHIVFIGRIASPWTSRQTCPKNMRAAREAGQATTVLID